MSPTHSSGEEKLRRSIEFEISVLRDYQAEKPGMLGKLAGEIADALDEALRGEGIHAQLASLKGDT